MKKYILKPGNHQFAPSSPAVHNNDNLTDEEAEWYLQRYPHIVMLFAVQPPEEEFFEVEEKKIKMKRRRIKRVEASTPSSADKGSI